MLRIQSEKVIKSTVHMEFRFDRITLATLPTLITYHENFILVLWYCIQYIFSKSFGGLCTLIVCIILFVLNSLLPLDLLKYTLFNFCCIMPTSKSQ